MDGYILGPGLSVTATQTEHPGLTQQMLSLTHKTETEGMTPEDTILEDFYISYIALYLIDIFIYTHSQIHTQSNTHTHTQRSIDLRLHRCSTQN